MSALARYGATVNAAPRVREVAEIVNEILGPDQVCLTLIHMALDEDIPTQKATVSAVIEIEKEAGTRQVELEGTGVGLLDAFFDGLVNFFSKEYASLKTLTIVDYQVQFGAEEIHGRNTDADARAILRVQNADELEYEFAQQTPSVTYSSALAAINVVNFFINSEMAYVRMHMALKDAMERRRSDLVETYRAKMAVLVHATSYSEVVKRLESVEE
ncbi:MAG: hypothetical protein CMH56_16935 [Myxococcales bacterium]|nr:hypothetical protein [Myxococcales bacterium]